MKSGKDETFIPISATFCVRTEVGTTFQLAVPDAIVTVICAPNDGWSYHPKHVEQFTEI